MSNEEENKKSSNYAAISAISVVLALVLYVLSPPFALRILLTIGVDPDKLNWIYQPLELLTDTPLEDPLRTYYGMMIDWLGISF